MFGLVPSKVITIPNGVDLCRLSPTSDPGHARAAFGIPSDAQLVLWVGALSEEKDPLAFLRIVSRLDGEPFALLVGDGPLADACRRSVEELHLTDRVRFAGVRNDMGDIYASADVVALTSRTEGMPAVLIEAGVLGVPAVSYALTGVGEVVIDGRTGSMVPVGDEVALASKLSDLLRDPRRRTEMGSAARAYCARFDISNIADSYHALYRRLV